MTNLKADFLVPIMRSMWLMTEAVREFPIINDNIGAIKMREPKKKKSASPNLVL